MPKLTAMTRRSTIAGLASAAIAAPVAWAQELRIVAAADRCGIIFGTAVEPQYIADDHYGHLVASQCRSLTAENALKWDAIRPGPGRFDFGAAEVIAQFASRRHMMLYGHCLIWHEALPAWFPSEPSRAEAERLLKDHIQTTVGHFKGRVSAWDVVNEAVERNDHRQDGLRRSPWLNAIGPDYLSQAYHVAHATDPQAKLVLSDYGLEYDDESWMVEKRGTMLEVLHRLVASKTPLHALGIQAHLIGERRPAYGNGLRAFLRAVAGLGLEIYITELDVDDHKISGSAEARDRIVAEHYAEFLACALDEPAVKRVTTWGLSDRYTSKRDLAPRSDGQGVRPLPFDRDMAPKPAALAVRRAFLSAPRRTL